MLFRRPAALALIAARVFACSADEPADTRPKGLSLCTALDPTICIGAPSNWPPDDELRLAYTWKKACEQNAWIACTSLGVLYEEGRVVHKVPARSISLYNSACKGGDGEACFRLSRLYESGAVSNIKMPSAADEMRAKACANGFARGCPDGGPEIRVVEEVLPEAGRVLAKQCETGNGRACNDLGWNHQRGLDGFAKDEAKSVPYYQRACDLGYARGCDNLGWTHQKGIGVTRNDKRAFAAYVKACDGGDANGCNNLGWLYRNGFGTPRDEVLAAPLFEKACAAKNKFGCANLAWLYHNGRGVAKDPTKAESLDRQACALGYRDACDGAKRLSR